MKAWPKHPGRVAGRLVWLGGELMFASFSYAISCAFCPRADLPIARARWLQRAARRILRIFQFESEVVGKIPAEGLLVSNHLSYVDVLFLAAVAPCTFVAKQEIEGWPIFGWFAAWSGTVFVAREKRAQTAQVAGQIEDALSTGVLVVLFPEATSSGGDAILPFKSSLLEPAARSAHRVTACHLQYHLTDGDVSEEVCYWKDMTMVPHVINLLSKRSVQGSMRLAPIRERICDRKELARHLHQEVSKLKKAAEIQGQTFQINNGARHRFAATPAVTQFPGYL